VYLGSVVLRGQAVCEANSVLDRIRGRFGIDVRDGACEEADLRRRRGDAFRFCRAILIQKDAASYAEQFEGMYALMRGLTTVFSFAATYHFGWGLGSRLPSIREFPVLIELFIVIAVALGGLLGEKGWMYLAAVGLFFLGAWFGSLRSQSSQTVLPLLLGVGVVSGVIAYRCYGAYRRFARTFAASVYQDSFALGQDNFTGI